MAAAGPGAQFIGVGWMDSREQGGGEQHREN